MSKSADKSLEFRALIGMVAFASLNIGPSDPKVPAYCRATADAWTTFVRNGENATVDELNKYDAETHEFMARASVVAAKLDYKMLDAAEELREMAAQYEADYGHKEEEAVA